MRTIITLIFLCMAVAVHAQSFEEYRQQAMEDFNNYRKERQREFDAYRDSINARFAEYMRKPWVRHDVHPAIPVPDRPEPPQPYVKDPDAEPSNDPLPFDKVIPVPLPVQPPLPFQPIPEPEKNDTPTMSFVFYGTKCTVSLGPEYDFTLHGADENSVSDAWKALSSGNYLDIVYECLTWRDRLCLCDWGYIRFVGQMADAFFPYRKRNEARLLQMYILVNSGYKVRIARADKDLLLLLPSENEIYRHPFLSIQGTKYYVADPKTDCSSIHLLDNKYPGEQYFSLQIYSEPVFSVRIAEPRRLTSKRYGTSADVAVNLNLIDFYNDYPLSDYWDLYARTSLSTLAKNQLYPVLQAKIAGKGKPAAANILIDFVQTAFEYKTDDEQFGGERPLFPDEVFHYPYSDCEDRAILYSVLVHDLLDLDVVLLNYPGHLATAVCFGEGISGDYIILDGQKYIVCDPTYIGASIGDAMPKFKETPVKVIRIN